MYRAIAIFALFATPAAAQYYQPPQYTPPPSSVPYSQVRPWSPPALPPGSPGTMIPMPPPQPAPQPLYWKP